jgi:hypothetical protein
MEFTLESGLLRLAFVKRDDRYAQRIELQRGADFILFWESVEGFDPEISPSPPLPFSSSSLAWPPSPPFQEVHLESRADGKQIALAVGRAGTSHWSLSVEPFLSGSGFVFDVACRVRERPIELGSSYLRLNQRGDGEAEPPLSAFPGGAWERGGTLPTVEFTFTPEFEEQVRLEFYPDRWNIFPADLTGPFPRTIRWQYQVASTE